MNDFVDVLPGIKNVNCNDICLFAGKATFL